MDPQLLIKPYKSETAWKAARNKEKYNRQKIAEKLAVLESRIDDLAAQEHKITEAISKAEAEDSQGDMFSRVGFHDEIEPLKEKLADAKRELEAMFEAIFSNHFRTTLPQ